MRKILINIGERSKQAFAQPINTHKKNKVLSDYLKMIRKNKHLILKENKKDNYKFIKFNDLFFLKLKFCYIKNKFFKFSFSLIL